ncbi:MAG: His/Gly/Thr/Pro-type tRNA ligase C-terminal domain-containing protein [Candidatus Dormibacteria bacterium]
MRYPRAFELIFSTTEFEQRRMDHQTFACSAGLRVEVDARAERMQAKIRHAELQKVPYIAVVGGRDEVVGTVSLRRRLEGDLGAMRPSEVRDLLVQQVATRQ